MIAMIVVTLCNRLRGASQPEASIGVRTRSHTLRDGQARLVVALGEARRPMGCYMVAEAWRRPLL